LLSAEIPRVREGFTKPIFTISLDINLAHRGIGISSLINTKSHNYGIGASFRASSEEWPSVYRSSDLWVELTIAPDGTLEHPPKTLAQRLFTREQSPLSVLALLRRIQRDKSIGGVVLNIDGFSFGDAKAEEWRDAVLGLRQADKEVVIYLDSPSERDYFIASAASKIYMNKQATLSLKDFQATLVYFADMLEKIGIKADAAVAGTYKTAPRQWTNSRPRKEEIEVAHNILNSFYDTFLSEIAEARDIDRNLLKILFDKGELSADEAKTAGLVDDLISSGDAVDTVIHNKNRSLTFFNGYENRVFKQEAWHTPKKIAVIPINDTIVDDRVLPSIFSGFFPVTGAKDVVDQINDAVDDKEVVGIIVRIDSPGGDAVAGHKINHAITTAQKTNRERSYTCYAQYHHRIDRCFLSYVFGRKTC
jgi:protease-4